MSSPGMLSGMRTRSGMRRFWMPRSSGTRRYSGTGKSFWMFRPSAGRLSRFWKCLRSSGMDRTAWNRRFGCHRKDSYCIFTRSSLIIFSRTCFLSPCRSTVYSITHFFEKEMPNFFLFPEKILVFYLYVKSCYHTVSFLLPNCFKGGIS